MLSITARLNFLAMGVYSKGTHLIMKTDIIAVIGAGPYGAGPAITRSYQATTPAVIAVL